MNEFKKWMIENFDYSERTISNICSRVRRADSILKIHEDNVYLFELSQEPEFMRLSTSVKSQIKKAIKLFLEYKYQNAKVVESFKVLSLFANIGVAEGFLNELGIDVPVANEIDERRAKLYQGIYPDSNMICGDITDEEVLKKIILESSIAGVNVIMATPPCQGMSTAGPLKYDDERNYLFLPVISIIKRIKPLYVMIENVPLFLSTRVMYHKKEMLITEVISKELGSDYEIREYVIDTKNYSVPQSRERAILLFTRRNSCLKSWTLPEMDPQIITMEDAIGHLPKLDPFIKDISEAEFLSLFPDYEKRRLLGEQISKWHKPPIHLLRQVIAMRYTKTGETAFNNIEYYPKKETGERVKGFLNTYKRQRWDTPAYTVTMDNRKISSQNNVHPGRLEEIDDRGNAIYSDPRVLTLYEIMKIMTIPDDWNIPSNTSEAFLRRIIGEGIPPLFVKKLFENLLNE